MFSDDDTGNCIEVRQRFCRMYSHVSLKVLAKLMALALHSGPARSLVYVNYVHRLCTMAHPADTAIVSAGVLRLIYFGIALCSPGSAILDVHTTKSL